MATMGLKNLVIRLTKGGTVPSGGLASVRWAGWSGEASIQQFCGFCHSFIASSHAALRNWAFVSGGGGLGLDAPLPL